MTKFMKSLLLAEIDAKVNELASQAFPPQRFEDFKNGDLDCRIVLLGTIAEVAGDRKIAKACLEWMEIINA